MVFVGNPRAIECALLYMWRGKECTNILHYDYGAVPTEGDVAATAQEVANEFGSTLPSLLSFDISLVGVRARSLEDPAAPQSEYRFPAPLVGAARFESVPSNVAFVLTLRTARPGRSYRGRIFVPGLTGGAVVNNQLDSGTANSIQSAFAALRLVTVGGREIDMSIYSRFSGGAARAEGVLTHVSSVAYRNLRIDTQRRRLPRD